MRAWQKNWVCPLAGKLRALWWPAMLGDACLLLLAGPEPEPGRLNTPLSALKMLVRRCLIATVPRGHVCPHML